MNFLIVLPIILALILGAVLYFIKLENDEQINKYAVYFTGIISIFSIFTIIIGKGLSVKLFSFTDTLSIAFKIDGLSVLFGCMVSILWPLAVIYATEYMKHEGGQRKFFTFYIMTFGVTLAVAFSANMLTMYMCYELLTFITLPLVTHAMDERAKYAGNKYIMYSVSGASISFIGIMLIYSQTSSLEFLQNGLVNSGNNVVFVAYLLMFLGFGVKAAVFPFHGWLPAASVAPTTVTALLHAVAVVKVGVFAIMRTTYYFVGADALSGTWVQNVTMIFAIVTICYGSLTAARSLHLKRRLAYSTVSQLSYMLFGVTLMSTAGFAGGLLHMVAHAFIKIVLFYCAGAILYTNHKEYVNELEGYAKKMPKTFFMFTICSLALIGIPPLPGFLSKATIINAAANIGIIDFNNASATSIIAFLGIMAIMISAFLTGLYLLDIVIKGYLPSKAFDKGTLENVKEAPKAMIIPMEIITAIVILMMLFSNRIFAYIMNIAGGGI